jgi:hypothetical protein
MALIARTRLRMPHAPYPATYNPESIRWSSSARSACRGRDEESAIEGESARPGPSDPISYLSIFHVSGRGSRWACPSVAHEATKFIYYVKENAGEKNWAKKMSIKLLGGCQTCARFIIIKGRKFRFVK